MTLDTQWIELLPIYSRDGDSVFADYEEYVINGELAQYQQIVQYGKKEGETLESHVLKGVGVLETLRPRLKLREEEARVLYTAFTIHDINKARNDQQAFSKLATSNVLAQEIERLKLGNFCPNWEHYLADIISLVRSHSGHLHVGGEAWIVKRDPQYGLGLQRVNALIHLMRAADVIGLSHTLQERTHKGTFLSHLNAYLADSYIDEQYVFHTHQLVEQRGLLTNVLHNGLMEAIAEDTGWLPLLLYADGVAYVGHKGATFDLGEERLRLFSRRIEENLGEITFGDPADLLEQTNQGIKFKPDALASGLPFEILLRQAKNLVSRRKFRYDDLSEKARSRAAIPKTFTQDTDLAQALKARLDDPVRLIEASESQMRRAELARTYFIFLNDHFKALRDKWQRIYRLLELSQERFLFYECFDARYDRCYILAGDIALSEDDVYARIAADGQALLDELAKAPTKDHADQGILWAEYLRLYLTLDEKPVSSNGWETHLAQYVKNQQQQCVHCSGPFEVIPWRKADVRDDIDVQKFSNRLQGGGNREPVKQICKVCRIQFLLESLNYPSVRGENTLYLHLFPYSFLTYPYVRGLVNAFNKLRDTDIALQALNMDVNTAVEQVIEQVPVRPRFRDQTKQRKPQPYGIYIPRYAQTVAGVIIFPINPVGENDTEQYLFALWNGLVLQRALNMKVLLSKDPVPPLNAEALPDLFLDMIPLACTGLVPRNDYENRTDRHGQSGTLTVLWQRTTNLFGLKRLLAREDDPIPNIVRAMNQGPLHIFFEVDRLLEKGKKNQAHIAKRAFPHVQALAFDVGGAWMAQLSDILSRLAEIAWQGGLRGRSLQRSSLLYPVSEVLTKMAALGGERDAETIIAATTQDIFEHLERISTGYKVGAKKWRAASEFVNIWYSDILKGVYGGNPQKLLRDEKLLRSAYLFYIQAQIPSKVKEEESEE